MINDPHVNLLQPWNRPLLPTQIHRRIKPNQRSQYQRLHPDPKRRPQHRCETRRMIHRHRRQSRVMPTLEIKDFRVRTAQMPEHVGLAHGEIGEVLRDGGDGDVGVEILAEVRREAVFEVASEVGVVDCKGKCARCREGWWSRRVARLAFGHGDTAD
jgi:hypothetical protein